MDPERPGEVAPSGVFFDTGGAAGIVRPEPCALCGAGPVSLQKYMYVMSFLILTQHKRYELLLCRACSTRQGLKEMSKSAFLGWWGISWGVMTFWALWVNTRTLFRWSNLAPVAALVLGLVCLLPPAALGAWLYHSFAVEDAARATGDWLDEETIALVNEGIGKANENDLQAALDSFGAAYDRAPGSSIVNYSMANALYSLGLNREALPYAARAETINPESSSCIGLYGTLLLLTGDKEGARTRADRLRGRDPEDEIDAQWMVSLFEVNGEYGEMLAAAERGLTLSPGNSSLKIGRIDALLRLDQWKEAEKHLVDLDAESQALPYVRFMKIMPRMKEEPMAGLDELLVLWKEGKVDDIQMERVVNLARGLMDTEAIRAKVIFWLHDESTDADMWLHARPWFSEEEWLQQLDTYLAREPEPLLALLRIQEMDYITENHRIIELADSVRATPNHWAQAADDVYFDALSREVPVDRLLDELQSHVEKNTSHPQCLVRLCRALIEVRYEAASQCLDSAEKLIGERPSSGQYIKVLRAELRAVEGQPSEALDDMQRLTPDASTSGTFRIYLAEAAFHAGRVRTLDETLKEIGAGEDPALEAPALLLRWSEQIVQGIVPTYNLDVDPYVKAGGDTIKRSESVAAHAILVAEGVEDRSWARKVVGDRSPETFDLVAAIKRTAANGIIDLSLFESLASSPRRGAYGVRLARTIVERSRRLSGKASS